MDGPFFKASAISCTLGIAVFFSVALKGNINRWYALLIKSASTPLQGLQRCWETDHVTAVSAQKPGTYCAIHDQFSQSVPFEYYRSRVTNTLIEYF